MTMLKSTNPQHLPSVTKAKYVKDYLIEVKFNDGTMKVIDFAPWLRGPYSNR
jgi:hypothetical protein